MRVLAGGVIAEGIADAYPVKRETKVIDLPPAEVERMVGIRLSAQEITGILEGLEFQVEGIGGAGAPQPDGVLRVTVPTFRLDVEGKADLVEEVARINGSEKIPMTLMADELPPQRNNTMREGMEQAKDVLVGCGLNEVISYSLIGLEDQNRLLSAYTGPLPCAALRTPEEGAYPVPCILGASDCIQLANPLALERRLMRSTLLSSLLGTVRDNLRYQKRVTIFEVANVYLPRAGQELPDEPRHVGIVLTGPREPSWWSGNGSGEALDFFDLKGIVEVLLERLGAEPVYYLPSDSLIFQPGRAARIVLKDIELGVMGELHPSVREAFDLPRQRVCALEADLDLLLRNAAGGLHYQPISRFPSVAQDLALVVDEAIPAQQVEALIRLVGGESVAEVRLFDVYRGDPVPAGKKSLAYSIAYQDMERTLTDKNVARIREKIRVQLEREAGAVIRSA